MINDKPSAPVPEKDFVREHDGFSDAALNLGNVAYEEFKALQPDSRSNQVLEADGVLPGIELFDPGATTRADTNDGHSQSSDIALMKPEDIGTESNAQQFSLLESGMKVKEVPPSYYGDSKESHYDNGTVRHEFGDGTTIELRPNNMTVAEDADHNVTIKLPSGEYVERSPKYPNKEIKTTDVKDDGTVIYTYKDGTLDTILPPPDNERVVMGERYNDIYDAGGKIKFTEDKLTGNKHWPLPNGHTLIEDKHGNQREVDELGTPVKSTHRTGKGRH